MQQTESKVRYVEIRVPLSTGPIQGYVSPRAHVDFHFNHRSQKYAMRRLLDGLIESRARLQNGRLVSTMPEALRWLAEQLAVQLEQAAE